MLEGKRIRIPKLGWVRMREALRFEGKIHSATVCRTADQWYVSLCVELRETPAPCESQEGIGVDLGINRLATLSNGEMFEGPRPLTKANFYEIAIEDLNVKGMMHNHRLARAILDMGFHEFRRQLVYKSRLRRCHVVTVDRWFPSSKMCSRCGAIQGDLSLGERTFRCGSCGRVIDRDLNAANNVARIVFDPLSTVSSTGIHACGEASAGSGMGLSETSL